MPKVRELTGTPWHVEKLTRGEGDERRHKSRCVYYRKPDSYCKYQYIKCSGSRYCRYYKAKEIEELPKYDDSPVNIKEVVEKITDTDGKMLYPIGSKVLHQKFGEGVVTDILDGHISIDFDDAGEKVLGLDVCIANGYLKVLEKAIAQDEKEADVSEVTAIVDEVSNHPQSSEETIGEKSKWGWLGKLFSGLFKRRKND